jgi:adenine-specific DNA-methyltransferase
VFPAREGIKTVQVMPQKLQLQNWSKEQLIDEVARLRKRKKYGLVWEDKPEDVVEQCKTELPVLKEVKNKAITKDKNGPVNILIEGDNYHALSILNYTHKGKIDVIYIDPPYNTGAKDWKYNNDYVEAEDPWRHSKWLSMMDKRLRFAKNLLNKKGVLICAIDDYELNTLGLLLDELFPSYERSTIIVEHHPQGAGSITVSRTHEYAYVLTPKGIGIEGKVITTGEDRWPLRRSGQGENNWRENRPNSFFAVLVDETKGVVVGVGPEITKEIKKYPIGKTPEGYLRIYPIDKHGKERVWRYNRASMQKLIDEGSIEYTVNGSLVVKKDGTTAAPIFSVWKGSRYNAGVGGSNLLTQIMGEANSFPYPKSLYTVVDMLAMVLRHKKDAIILDFFAGSGTTGHAVFELNQEDDGNRRFILCTNNENGIASEVCYPRVAKIIEGYKGPDGKKVAGLGGNLKYFKTAFAGSEPNDKNKEALTRQATEILCMREDTLELVKETGSVKIFKNSKQHTGIVFDENAIPAFKKDIAKIGGAWSLYIFSLGDDTYEDEFEDMKQKITVAPIPEAILRVYRRLFKP